jgi:ferredoxin hydrogenase large subunit
MSYFQVNEKCNGCLACVQNCPGRALDARETDGVQTLLHNMARCARCATCWRVCPQEAIEFQHILENRWDEVVTHALVRCTVCGEVVYAQSLTESLDKKVRELVEPLCSRHKMERQADTLSGKSPAAGGGTP